MVRQKLMRLSLGSQLSYTAAPLFVGCVRGDRYMWLFRMVKILQNWVAPKACYCIVLHPIAIVARLDTLDYLLDVLVPDVL